MLVYLTTKSVPVCGLQQFAAVLIDPVTRREVYSAVRWDENMALQAARAWAAQRGYLPTEFKVRGHL